MKYWLFQNNQVSGPYDREQIAQIKGFSAESLVCPEGRKGTEMGDWQRAGMVQELAETLLRGAKVPAAASGGSVGLLPPEPTLKDLAAMGALQEKTQLLENALHQIQEELKTRDVEIQRLKEQSGERERAASELRLKLSEMESRMIEVADTASKVSGLAGVQEDVGALKRVIETQNSTIKSLKEKFDASAGQAKAAAAKAIELLPVDDVGKESLRPAAETPGASRPEDQDRPFAVLRDVVAEPTAPPSAQATVPIPSDMPPVETTEQKTQKIEPIKLDAPPPSAEILPAPQAAPPSAAEPPMSGAGGPMKKSAVPKMGRIAEQEGVQPVVEPSAGPAAKAELPKVEELLRPASEIKFAAEAQAARAKALPAKGEKAPAKKPNVVLSSSVISSNRFLAVAAASALAAVGALYFVAVKVSKSRKAPKAEGASELKMPAGSEASNPSPTANKNAGPESAGPAAPESAKLPSGAPGGPLGQDPTQDAVDLAKTFKIPGTAATLSQRLESAYPPSGGLSPWMVEKLDEDKYQVNFYAPGAKMTGPDGKSRQLVYEFLARPGSRTLEGRNPPAQSVLRGEAPVPPAAAKAAKSQVPAKLAAAKPAAAKKRKPVRKTKAARRSEVEGPLGGKSVASDQTKESSGIDEKAFPTKKEGETGAANSEGDVSLDQLLLPGVPKPAATGAKKPRKKQRTPPAQPAGADSTGGDSVPSDSIKP